MALYPIDRDPGPWLQFVKRTDVKDLNLNEQKSQFLKEQLQFQDFLSKQSIMQRQYQDYMSNQVNGGGEDITNGVEQISFSNNPLNTITGFTSNLFIKFIEPVVVETNSGVNIPTVNIANDQDGAGATNPIVYSFNAGLSSGPVVGFTYTQAAAAGNNGGVAASVVPLADIVPGATTVTGPTVTEAGTAVTHTALAKTTGWTTSGAGTGAVFTVVTATADDQTNVAGALTSVTATTLGTGFIPGETITFVDGALGAGMLKTTRNVLAITTGAAKTAIGNVTGPFEITPASAITGGTQQTGTGVSFLLEGDGAGNLSVAVVNDTGKDYVTANVITITQLELTNAGFTGAVGVLTITLGADDVTTSTGASIIIAAAQLTPDILTTAGTVISENGGAIYDAGTDPADELNLDYALLAAVTLAATPA